jgi:nucleotide-binding universal stress UspA family protein
MQRFKNILLVLTDHNDEDALKRAGSIIKSNKGRLTIVKVRAKISERLLSRVTANYRLDIQEVAVREFQRSMHSILAPLIQQGVDVHGKFLFGHPFLEIIRQVLREKHDLVMSTAEEDEFSQTALFGSTAMHLMRKCPCPVWMGKPSAKKTYSRIMAAVDPDPVDTTRHGLNPRILDLATSLARSEHSELHVIHCWRLPLEGTLRARQEFSKDTVDSMIEDLREVHRQRLKKLLDAQNMDGITTHIHQLKGNPGILINRIAAEQDIDLVVMGTVCRTGIAGFFIGNTAEKVLQDIQCGVLAIKPEGFQTPVTLE